MPYKVFARAVEERGEIVTAGCQKDDVDNLVYHIDAESGEYTESGAPVLEKLPDRHAGGNPEDAPEDTEKSIRDKYKDQERGGYTE